MKKGATTQAIAQAMADPIIALRNEKGSYNRKRLVLLDSKIIALRNEKGSYNTE